MKEQRISIWFFIGLQLAIFGVLIAGASLYDVWFPPAVHTVLERLHAGVYWGVLMLALGIFYVIKFRPRRGDGI